MVNWLRQDRYYEQVKEQFTSELAARFFDTDELVRLLDEHIVAIQTDNPVIFISVRDFLTR